jgi:predicted  nucleic acid-binding Zn-ribbon protein
MLSSDDTTYTSTEPIERSFRASSRRELINEKRHRNTDILTHTNGENGKTVVRQLRQENRRLRWELDELQHLVYQHKQTQAQLEKEIETIHLRHQDIIEQYEINLHEMIDERNQLQEAKQVLEQRYQELYHSFHDTVEEEATKMVEEAARTLVLSPEHTPALLRDVAKTLEFQVKQTEDQHVAELLSLMRQAQHKAALLEEELANEREKIAAERQNLLALQNSISQQAQFRYDTIRKHLQARWTLVVTLMSAVLILLVPIFQLVFFSIKAPLFIALFFPALICVGLAFLVARERTNNSLQQANKQLNQKKTTKLVQAPTAKKG